MFQLAFKFPKFVEDSVPAVFDFVETENLRVAGRYFGTERVVSVSARAVVVQRLREVGVTFEGRNRLLLTELDYLGRKVDDHVLLV